MLLLAGVGLLVFVAMANKKPQNAPNKPPTTTTQTTGNNKNPVDPTKAGEALSGAAIGAAIGAAVGAADVYMLNVQNRNAPGVAQAIGPVMAGIGAAVGAAVVAGGIGIGTVGIWAFPVFVFTFAIFDIATTVEMSMRNEKERQYQQVAQGLFDARKYMECVEYVAQKRVEGATYDDKGNMKTPGYNVSFPGKIAYIGLPLDATVFGDAPNLPLADKDGNPTGQYVATFELLTAAYKPAVDAFLKVRGGSVAWGDEQRANWLAANSDLFKTGDFVASLIPQAMPWFAKGSFVWRPQWPATISHVVNNTDLSGSTVGPSTPPTDVDPTAGTTGFQGTHTTGGGKPVTIIPKSTKQGVTEPDTGGSTTTNDYPAGYGLANSHTKVGV